MILCRTIASSTTDARSFVKRAECLSWLFWQMGSAPFLGGGFGHLYAYAPSQIEYAIDRYKDWESNHIKTTIKLFCDIASLHIYYISGAAWVLALGQLPEMFRFDRFCFYCVRRSLPRSDGHLCLPPLPTDALIKLNVRCCLARLIPLRG